MKTLTRFMIKSFAGPIAMTFFIVTFILMLNFLWLYIDEIVGKGLPPSVILELIFYATGTLIPMGLPLATLLAAIMTMGSLGENYELLALKAAGISLQRIMRPIIYVTILIAIGSFFIINNFVPYSYNKMNTLLTDVRQQRQQIEFKNGIFFNGIPNVAIKVTNQDKDTKLLSEVVIYDNRDSNNPTTILADSGYISLSHNKEFLQIKLYDGSTYEDNRSANWHSDPSLRCHLFSYQEILIPLDGFAFKRTEDQAFGDNANSKNIAQLTADIDSLSAITDQKVKDFSLKTNYKYLFSFDTTVMSMNDSIRAAKTAVLTRENIDFDTLSIEDKNKVLDAVVSNLNNYKYFASGEHNNVRTSSVNLYKSQMSWYKKITLPVSIIIFFLIGASLGAIIRKGGLGTPIVISVLFFVIYYILTMTGDKLVVDGAWSPHVGMWLSSLVLGPLAIFLSIKATSDSPLLNSDVYIMRVKAIIDRIKIEINKLRKNEIRK